MAARTLPNLGLSAFFTLGEDGWDDEMSLNLLKLSILTQGNVISVVSATPGAPTNGDVHIFDATHPTQPNKVAVRDDGAWVYFTPVEGWLLYNKATDNFMKFDGAAWVVLAVASTAAYMVPFGFSATPTANEVLLVHVLGRATTFADDFASSEDSVGANPAATFAMDVKLNGVSVGTISVSTGGVTTFTTSGTTVVGAKGDRLSVHAPATPDTTIVNSAWTLIGS